jgi:hypothetical protein
MFRGFFAAIRALIPKRHEHLWTTTKVIQYDPVAGRYWVDRSCLNCDRRERRYYVPGPRRGDAREITPDPFGKWEPVKGDG